MPTNTRNLAWFVVLPVLALVPVFAGPRTREVAPAAAVAPAVASPVALLAPPAAAAWSDGGSIHFEARATQIRPGDTKMLDAHAAWLRGNRKQRLMIEGYTDGAGGAARSAG